MLQTLRLWEGKHLFLYLLSDYIRVVTRLNLEGAVVRPQIDGVGDAGHSPLVNHFGRLRPRDGELQVCILLPVSEQEWELGEEAIVELPGCGDRLGTGIAVEATLQRFSCTDKLFPVLEIIRILELRRWSAVHPQRDGRCNKPIPLLHSAF